jgi:hypothetical protein
LHRLDLAAGARDFLGNLVDGILDALFLGRCLQYKQTFVSFHFVPD